MRRCVDGRNRRVKANGTRYGDNIGYLGALAKDDTTPVIFEMVELPGLGDPVEVVLAAAYEGV